MKKNNEKNMITGKKLLLFLGFFFILFGVSFSGYVFANKTVKPGEPLNAEERARLEQLLETEYPQPLVTLPPYSIFPLNQTIHAKSAILIDSANGTILFEKNANEIIPPASMTKLVVMYVVFKEIAAGRANLDDVVFLPPESWAVNAPPHSSLMFLDRGQRVTLDELLTGLAVVSGNDAAIAVAIHISGSVDAFVQRMNQEVQQLGLKNTVFVEPSGYSEFNLTTAKDFAAFCRLYIKDNPQTLEKYHSLKKLSYPLAQNMPEGQENNPQPYIQFASNKLLNDLAGCDGLKTGFIYESGYNLALTVQRENTRFISVTMGGPGRNSAEGNKYRNRDGVLMTEWAFKNFYSLSAPEKAVIPIRVWGGAKNSIILEEYPSETITIPRGLIGSGDSLVRTLDIPENLRAPIKAGTAYGKAIYTVGGTVVREVPLVAVQSVSQANWFKRSVDAVVERLFSLFPSN